MQKSLLLLVITLLVSCNYEKEIQKLKQGTIFFCWHAFGSLIN